MRPVPSSTSGKKECWLAVYVVCKDHLDEAIEEFLDAYEASPDIHRLKDITFTEWTAPPVCHFCSRAPEFLVV